LTQLIAEQCFMTNQAIEPILLRSKNGSPAPAASERLPFLAVACLHQLCELLLVDSDFEHFGLICDRNSLSYQDLTLVDAFSRRASTCASQTIANHAADGRLWLT
jgi:hypothetical protein